MVLYNYVVRHAYLQITIGNLLTFTGCNDYALIHLLVYMLCKKTARYILSCSTDKFNLYT